MHIKAIPTRYKGYHFRSRLEARWAVFFDTAGIPYAYEEQGFEKRYSEDDPNPVRYLPDFRIGESHSNIFVEVKGDKTELTKNADALDALHDFGGVLPGFNCSVGSKNGLILLGDIPFPDEKIVLHPIVQHRKGLVKSYAVFTAYAPWSAIEVIESSFLSNTIGCSPAGCDWDNSCKIIDLGVFYPHINDAYKAARSARFEHGESGAT